MVVPEKKGGNAPSAKGKPGASGMPEPEVKRQTGLEEPEPEGLEAKQAKAAAEADAKISGLDSLMGMDQFPFYPRYKYRGYRSYQGAAGSFLLMGIFIWRFTDTLVTFITDPPQIYTAKGDFERDSAQFFALPKLGVFFSNDGQNPFYDPTYIKLVYEQGLIRESGNMSFTPLGFVSCSFVEQYGRLIQSNALCPEHKGVIQGHFQDKTFQFVRLRVMRCANQSDEYGTPQPGMCKPKEEIDRMVWKGTMSLYVEEAEKTLDDSMIEYKINTYHQTFVTNVHLATDVTFTVLNITRNPQFVFDAYTPGFVRYSNYTLFETTNTMRGDFISDRAEFAAFYFSLADEVILQTRTYTGLYAMFESWGATGAFLLIFLAVPIMQFNKVFFNRQMRGLDIRELDKAQFSVFGELHNNSFSVPPEFQDRYIRKYAKAVGHPISAAK